VIKAATKMDWVFLGACAVFVVVVVGSYVVEGYFSFVPVLFVGVIIALRLVQMRARGRAVQDD
jgi:hypothetical protein